MLFVWASLVWLSSVLACNMYTNTLITRAELEHTADGRKAIQCLYDIIVVRLNTGNTVFSVHHHACVSDWPNNKGLLTMLADVVRRDEPLAVSMDIIETTFKVINVDTDTTASKLKWCDTGRYYVSLYNEADCD